MGTRLELHDILLAICPNVYFQPPESQNLTYPCIKYEYSDMATKHANNKPYMLMDQYTITLLSRNVEDIMRKQIAKLERARFSRNFKVDGLNHDRFTLYY